MTKERRIEILESRISDPKISPRDLKSLSRELSILKGEFMPYDKRPVAERKPPEPPPEPTPSPSWLVRCNLVERVADRLRNAEQILTPEEVEAGQKADFTPEELLESVRRWNTEWYPEGYPKTREQWAEYDWLHPERNAATHRTILNGLEPKTPADFEAIESAGYHDLANFWRWRQQQVIATPAQT